MEPSSSQNMMPGLYRSSVTPGSVPPEYWNNLESLYSGPEPPHQHPHPTQQQQLQQSQQQQQTSSLGIDWDHPVFSQRHQQRSPLPPHQEQNHGIYSSTSQSWQPNPLHQHHQQQQQQPQKQQQLLSSTPQGYRIPTQYHQVHQYPQGQVAFDSRPLTTSDNASYQQYSFPRSYYSPQPLTVPDTFSQSPSTQVARSQTPQSTSYQPAIQQGPITQYSLPAGYSEENSINYTNNYTDSAIIPDPRTINPQFLNPAQQSSNQQSSLHNNFLYAEAGDFERPDDQKPFNFYHNDLQMPSIIGQPAISNRIVPGQNAKVEVVIPTNGQHNVMVSSMQAKGAEPQKKQASQRKQPKKAVATSKKSASSSSGSDGSDDSDLEIQAPEEPSPIPATRPSEPEAAVQYDTLQAVWSPHTRRPNADKVKNALVAFRDVVKTVRDAWKENTQAMKMAENKGENDKADQLKKHVVLQRRLMDVVISTTLDKGHPDIVKKLGEHPGAVAALYSFLLDRHQASDIDGALTVNILKLLARFVTMDEDVLHKTNFAKLLPRFVKKGGQTVKELSQQILDNAAASTKQKQESTKPVSKEGSPNKTPTPDAAATEGPRLDLAGTKRVREGEGNGQPATKRMVVTSNIKIVSKPNNTGANGPTKRSQEAGQENKATNTIAARQKANIVAPKPTNLFGSLSSASKKPGTSNAERAAAAAAKASMPADKNENQLPPPKPAFSFGDIMADLNKKKDSGPAEPAEDRPPETEEERQKRLRKEARRKLRVTWKPDESLTEVRLFTHDPEEELVPGDRSQGDVKGEGSVLKLHRDLDEMDEDEDGSIREESLMGYYVPSEIDEGETASEDRSRNYVKRGGTQQPTSPEKQAQDHREATTLMVFYTSQADVPPSPKEPPTNVEEPASETVSFGELPDHVKARQERYYSIVNPKPAPSAQPSVQDNQDNQFDISNLLKIIQNAPQQQSTPPPQPVSQAPMSDLERTIGMFRQQQQNIPQMPQMPQMTQPPSGSQAPGTQGVDFQKLLAIINTQKQLQQPPVLPQAPPAPPSQPGIAPNLAAIISQFTNQNQQAGSSQLPSQQHYEDPERKRMRETGGYDGPGEDRFGYSKRNKFSAPNKKHPKAGLVPCRYWREGKCLKGDDCTFRHDPLN